MNYHHTLRNIPEERRSHPIYFWENCHRIIQMGMLIETQYFLKYLRKCLHISSKCQCHCWCLSKVTDRSSRIVILHIPPELFTISTPSYFPLFTPVLWPFPSTCIGGDISRSQCPRGLRRRSSAARLLRLWVRIPPWTWMFVCCECCVLSGRVLCDGLIIRSEESYRLWRVVVCDHETSKTRRLKPATGLWKYNHSGL